ncbi:serine/threonine-protein kinase AtPK1/AtPK6-like [Amaranthus tricolor]|uniref:serine/threonine-protein kinase AtPK1/AtPK6-like n=1 Tax=Amaranthus tricolor TaxID=29722 RepID=UPI0025850FAC|nr:serine/threonine-protein kinase AtPK1/AtPK6-like [Amaranthus tricolor]XP_057549326.1 serine/threonine-protein kinase AtPK1/AtPK6-like [Amaranthus tricolor]
MVSSHLSVLNEKYKSFGSQLLLPDDPPNAILTDDDEFDFSDVFGPLPGQFPVEVNEGNLEIETNNIVYDNSAVVYRRSHSLVGPSACLSQSLKLGKLNLQETEEANVILECVNGVTIEGLSEISTDEDVTPLHPLQDDMLTKEPKVGLEDFEIMRLVGQGAFGKVYQVCKKGTSEIYAMKVMRKDKIMEKNHAEYMKAERDILTKIDHPFIVQLRYSFQSKYRLYLVLDFINGGHLFFQLDVQGLFREDLARVYAAEIVSAVSHLHSNGIMHRDLKPENILLDADGHVVLTDFGLAKELEENERSNSMCGTVEYMAPEIVQGKGHDKAADWWSVGVLIFEMLTGKPPFYGGNRNKIQQKIVKDKFKLPGFLSSEAHSVLKELLQKDPSKRLGSGVMGSEEVKCHKWFKPINWKKLEARQIQPSFRPDVAGKHCIANFEKKWTDMPVVISPAASPNGNGSLIFKDFSYVRPSSILQRMIPLNELA